MDNLCFECGHCCNGTLFDKVIVDDGDDLILPCINLTSDNKCSIYENRPHRCQRFFCPMLINYEKGMITKENALKLIADLSAGKVSKENFFRGTNLEEYYE